MNVSIAMHHAPLAALIPTTCSSELSRHAFGYLHRCRRAAKSLVAALPPGTADWDAWVPAYRCIPALPKADWKH